MLQIGEILRIRGLITHEQLTHALELQRKSGSRLGDILIGEGLIGYYALYQALAVHYQLPFVDLIKFPPDEDLPKAANAETYLWLQAIPWRTENGETIVAVCDLTDSVIAWAKRQYGHNVQFVFTSPFDIRRTVEHFFDEKLEESCRLSLWRQGHQQSARITIPFRQKQIFYGLLLIAFALAVQFPTYSVLGAIIVCHLIYTATMLFKCLVFAKGTVPPPVQPWEEKLAALDDRTLPVYTVLIPMYKEAESIPGLLESMGNLDYPPAKLDIKLVLESDDRQTLYAAQALKPRYNFDIIRVPPGTPRTKPRACNYALRFARGELVTVFDADDRPEREQLKKAVIAFRESPPDVICLQARLNYYNANDNLLTRFFSLEYTILFHFLLRGLERTGIPIPLGGTSNHIALSRLKQLGEWDPYNVTEDADLGIRLAARGWRTAMLDSYTMEEVPSSVMPWIRQRSRWIKGYLQTWLVHMRAPLPLYRNIGVKGFIGFQFFVGLSCLTFLTAPVVWGLSILWLTNQAAFPDWLVWLTMVNLFLNIGTHWLLALYCTALYRKHTFSMVVAAFLYPLYLILHSIASYKALWQLVVKPHFWEKTMHGLGSHIDLAIKEQDLVRIRA